MSTHRMDSPDNSQHNLTHESTVLLRLLSGIVTDNISSVDALSGMSSEGGSSVPTPRQYRPTYTKLRSSASTSNFGSPFLRATTKPVLNTKRRRTTSTFPAAENLHSAPTVASSALTASVSSNDISNPTPMPHRLSTLPRTRTPTRIPTPAPHLKISSTVRSVSSPAAVQKRKEVEVTLILDEDIANTQR